MSKRILYIHQYFKTPEEGGAIRSYYLAKGLVELGFTVEMLTAHAEKIPTQIKIDGINVHYLPVPYSNEMGFAKRLLSFYRFVRLAKKYIPQIKGIDLAYITSTPLTVGYLGLWLKKKKHIPYVFEVRDLWPTAPIEIGVIKGGLFKKYLYRLEKKIYQNAEKVVALSPDMQEWIEKVVPEQSVHVIPNMADCDFFQLESKDVRLEAFYHSQNKFVITYFGSIGTSNHLEYLLDIASLCQEQELNVAFKIVGKGSRKSHIKLMAYLKQLQNISFIGYLNKEGVKRILNITDATYVCFANYPVLGSNSPNKLFDSLAAGKLTLVNTSGWTKHLVEEHRCGFYANPEQPKEFIQQLVPFIENRALLNTYKDNARAVAEKFYAKKIQIEKLAELLKSIKNSD